MLKLIRLTVNIFLRLSCCSLTHPVFDFLFRNPLYPPLLYPSSASLVAIVIAFTICWTPFHAQRLLFLYVSLYAHWTDHLREINQVLFLAAGM